MPSPRYWREVPARLRLEGSKCKGCGKIAYPARRVCPSCRGAEMEPAAVSRKGKVVTWTVVRVSPDEFLMESPYPVAVVETPEGARMMVQVADCAPEEMKTGLAVDLEFRLIRKEGRGGILCYGFKAVPALEGTT